MIEKMIGITIPWNVIFLIFLTIAAVVDAKTSKIKNVIVVPMLLIGILSFSNTADLLFKIGSIIFILIIGYTRIMGMGDLKLWMGMAVYMGLLDSIYAIGAAAALFILFYLITDYKESVKILRIFKNQVLYEKKIERFEQKAHPFGPFMAVGSLVIMVWRFYGV